MRTKKKFVYWIGNWFMALTCSCFLTVGSCSLDSWSLAVNPGLGGADPFVGVNLDFGDTNLVVPILPFNN